MTTLATAPTTVLRRSDCLPQLRLHRHTLAHTLRLHRAAGARTLTLTPQGLFWILCICVTAVVILIAKFNSPNGDDFYYINKDKGLQRNMLSTVNIMCYWTVDFMVW